MQHNFPSVKTLLKIKPGGIRDASLSLQDAKIVRKILVAQTYDDLFALPVYEQYYEKCGRYMYNPHNLHELKMHMLDIVLCGYGIEGCQLKDDSWLECVNMGDTYDLTLCYFHGRYVVSSWGNIYERFGDMSN